MDSIIFDKLHNKHQRLNFVSSVDLKDYLSIICDILDLNLFYFVFLQVKIVKESKKYE